MNINFSPIYSSGYFTDGEEDDEKRDVINVGVRIKGWRDTVELKTGGKLNDLEGVVILHRGERDGESLGQLTYVSEYDDVDFGHGFSPVIADTSEKADTGRGNGVKPTSQSRLAIPHRSRDMQYRASL